MSAYTSGAKMYNLCLEEKLVCGRENQENRRTQYTKQKTEIISKYRHKNEFLVSTSTHMQKRVMSHSTSADHDVNG